MSTTSLAEIYLDGAISEVATRRSEFATILTTIYISLWKTPTEELSKLILNSLLWFSTSALGRQASITDVLGVGLRG